MSITVLATDKATPKTRLVPHVHPNSRPASAPSSVAGCGLNDGARNCDVPNRQEIFQVKMQADTEHHEDDADFRKLVRHCPVRYEARSVRTNDQTREQVADDRRQMKALCDESERQCRCETERKG
jgi:hypothetical protein